MARGRRRSGFALGVMPFRRITSARHSGRWREAGPWRDLVRQQHEQRLARGELAAEAGCIAWLISVNPYRRASDRDHFVAGLRKAGFEA